MLIYDEHRRRKGGGGGYSLQFIGHNILRFKVTGKKAPLIILIDVQL